MRTRKPVDDRQEFIVQRGRLVRTVHTTRGGTYRHRCSLDAFQAVCRFIEEHAAEGVTCEMIWHGVPEVPCTPAAVAVAFLKERGCLVVEHRRCYPTSQVFFEDALVEFHALTETAD